MASQKKQTLEELLQQLANVRGRPQLAMLGPVHRARCQELRSAIASLPEGQIDLVIQTFGGDADAAFLLIRRLRSKFNDVGGIVPTRAKSAGTLLCLGVNELVLAEAAELGPLDAQVQEKTEGDAPEWQSALNRFKALEHLQKHMIECLNLALFTIDRVPLKKSERVGHSVEFAARVTEPLMRQLRPERIGAAARSLEIGKEYAERLLIRYAKFEPNRARLVAERLVFGYPSHGFVLDVDELAGPLGLNARVADQVEQAVIDKLAAVLVEAPDRELFVVSPTQPPCGDADESLEPKGVAADTMSMLVDSAQGGDAVPVMGNDNGEPEGT
ncbi:MAG: hypothetical protein AAGB51_13490 [Planctomycetota bacterium]